MAIRTAGPARSMQIEGRAPSIRAIFDHASQGERVAGDSETGHHTPIVTPPVAAGLGRCSTASSVIAMRFRLARIHSNNRR